MSSRQTAAINGLLAENFGKNDLIRGAESRANDSERAANSLRSEVGGLAAQNRYLKEQLSIKEMQAADAKAQMETYKKEAEAFRELLSRPMKEIADINGDFKKTYELQQQMLAEWIMGQKAFKETAMQFGIELGKTVEEVQQTATQNANAVLENRTQHGNDSTTSPTLASHADAILAIRKKNGKA